MLSADALPQSNAIVQVSYLFSVRQLLQAAVLTDILPVTSFLSWLVPVVPEAIDPTNAVHQACCPPY